jgi:hypothetical protein
MQLLKISFLKHSLESECLKIAETFSFRCEFSFHLCVYCFVLDANQSLPSQSHPNFTFHPPSWREKQRSHLCSTIFMYRASVFCMKSFLFSVILFPLGQYLLSTNWTFVVNFSPQSFEAIHYDKFDIQVLSSHRCHFENPPFCWSEAIPVPRRIHGNSSWLHKPFTKWNS